MADGVRFESQEKAFLSFDLLCEVLSRVDAPTLARAACVSSEFRRVCVSEAYWERQCNSRWPSTKQPAARTLIAQTGGFRHFYAQCYPSMSGEEEDDSPARPDDSEPSPSNFVSIVDVVYNGQPLLSRVVAGFPGAEDPSPGWFEHCPFQFDLAEEEHRTAAVETDLGRLWSALSANLTASWILVDKSSGRMANLASWSSACGLRHWPCDDDFVLHFGTVPHRSVLCSVSVKAHAVVGPTTTVVGVTEVGMRLENEDGARLYGMESVAFLEGALRASRRTASQATVMGAYHGFRARQAARKAARIQRENRRELVAALVSGVGAVLCLSYILFLDKVMWKQPPIMRNNLVKPRKWRDTIFS